MCNPWQNYINYQVCVKAIRIPFLILRPTITQTSMGVLETCGRLLKRLRFNNLLTLYTHLYSYRLFEANKINGLFQLITNSNFPETLTLNVV